MIYETEDSGDDSGFYRYLPYDARRPEKGGQLQMLAVKGQPNYDTRTGQVLGKELRSGGCASTTPTPILEGGAPEVAKRGSGQGRGAVQPARGHLVRPAQRRLLLRVDQRRRRRLRPGLVLRRPREPPGAVVRVAGRVGARLARQPAGHPPAASCCARTTPAPAAAARPLAPEIENVNRLVGVSRDGEPFEFALNTMSDAEFAGACFSPDRSTLFANLLGAAPGSGMTVAIPVPWSRRPL